jgi:hypothetical protein
MLSVVFRFKVYTTIIQTLFTTVVKTKSDTKLVMKVSFMITEHRSKSVVLIDVISVIMNLNATFNNISAISWRSFLLVEETGGTGENYRPVASHSQRLHR